MSELLMPSEAILILAAFGGGLLSALVSWKVLKSSRTMILASLVLPSVVCAALLAINGSLGTGVAILGVFSLVRFRSLPGSAMDIVSVFYSMVIGLMFASGNLAMAAILSVVLAGIICVAAGITSRLGRPWELKILLPETVTDFDQFTRLIASCGKDVRLVHVRTTNMGTMYELEYSFIPDPAKTGELLDEIRVRNSNLNVSLRMSAENDTL